MFIVFFMEFESESVKLVNLSVVFFNSIVLVVDIRFLDLMMVGFFFWNFMVERVIEFSFEILVICM